jgi:murein L,D-transpeptidase YcbB/YkuD
MIKLIFIPLLLITLLGAQKIDLGEVSDREFFEKKALKRLYLLHHNDRLWRDEKQIVQLFDLINNPYLNYKAKPFHKEEIERLRQKDALSENEVVVLDILLSDSYLALMRFVRDGDMDWASFLKDLTQLKERKDIEAHWELNKPLVKDIVSLCYKAITKERMAQIDGLLPQDERYMRLIDQYRYYRDINTTTLQPFVYYEDKKLGDKDPRRNYNIRNIKKRMAQSGYLEEQKDYDRKFDAALEQAVKKLQRKYVVEESGVFDATVAYYLLHDVPTSLEKLELNIERLKRIKDQSSLDEYVLVNIPFFRLKHYQDNALLQELKVVLGRADRPTPIFSDKIETIVLNPFWNIPESLVKKDILTAMRSNPNYLKENNIRVFSNEKEVHLDAKKFNYKKYAKSKAHVPYRFVQSPGSENPLGRIKFLFPNQYYVYLHDTDSKALFDQKYRLFSSGCIRLQNPFEFLDNFIQYTPYTKEKLYRILESGKNRHIRLKKDIPITIEYISADIDGSGELILAKDLYKYDRLQVKHIRNDSAPF